VVFVVDLGLIAEDRHWLDEVFLQALGGVAWGHRDWVFS
jgi:hypothetical protein